MSSTDTAAAPEDAVAIDSESGFARREDIEVLTARRDYANDHHDPGMLHAAVYRSPHAHAYIDAIDLTEALALDGVFGGWSGESLPQFIRPMTAYDAPGIDTAPLQDATDADNPVINAFDHYPLARDKVRFVGEPVAIVVAEDPYLAEDALDRIVADYTLLDPVLDETDALESDDPLVYEDWGSNRQLRFEINGGDVNRALDDADHIIEEELRHHRFTSTPLEPRTVVASFNPDANHIEMVDSTQKPHIIAALVERCLDRPAVTVTINAEHVGGGFGSKTGFYPEELLVPALAIEFDRPVKWVERRHEHLTASVHAREQTHRLRVGVSDDGDIIGLEDEIIANSGAAYPHAGVPAHITTGQFIPGVYDIEHYRCVVESAVTNKAPFGAHRGFGKAEAAYISERLAKLIATELGLDPAAYRLQNFIQPDQFPYRSATGSNYDSGDYPAALKRAMDLAEYDAHRARQAERWANGATRSIGIGMAVCVEPSSASRRDSVSTPGYYAIRIRMDPNGRIVVYPEDPDLGTSHETSLVRIVSRELPIASDRVRVVQGDTEACPFGSGSYSSRFSVLGTAACYEATGRLATQLKRIAGAHMDEPEADLVLDERGVHSPRTGDRLSFEALAYTAYHLPYQLPAGMDPGLDITHYYMAPNVDFDLDGTGQVGSFSAHPYTADIAVVEVDTETGLFEIRDYVSVHDCGPMLNETIVEGQHLGALAHGFGGALLESLPYAADGNPRHQTFVNYAIPSAGEIPSVTIDHLETPSPFTPGGHKGAGETGTVSVPPAVTNAVEDALSPLGITFLDGSPMTPSHIWERIQTARD